MNFSALCRILVRFGPVTPEFTLLTITPFAAIWQKSAYHAKYLEIFWFNRCIVVDYYPNIQTLLWQPVKFGDGFVMHG